MTVRIHRHADHAARQVPHVVLAGGEERGVRPAETERHAEALRVAERDVGAHLARRGGERERQQIGGHRHEHARIVRLLDERAQVVEPSGFVGILHQRAEHVGAELHRIRGADAQLDAERFRAAAQHGDGLREAAIRHQEHAAGVAHLLALHAVQQRHGLPRRRPLVQQRGVGHLHPRQIRHHRLEIEERLEAACAISADTACKAYTSRILEHAAADHAGRERVGIAQTDEAAEDLVLLRDGLEAREICRLAFRGRQIQALVDADAGGNGFVDQVIERRRAHRLQHRLHIVSARADVTRGEGVEGVEKGNLLHFAIRAS